MNDFRGDLRGDADARKTGGEGLVWDARKTLGEGLAGIQRVLLAFYSYLLSCSGVAIAQSACLVIVCSDSREVMFPGMFQPLGVHASGNGKWNRETSG
jgi:hypothetical protein